MSNVNQRQRRCVTVPAFLAVSAFAVANCLFAIAGNVHYWRYQWTAVAAVVMLLAVEVCLFEPKKK